MAYNSKLELTRTLGFEIECFADVPTYTDSWGDECVDYDDFDINYCEVGSDGSLHGGHGEPVEVKTDPIKNLNIVEGVFEELGGYGMNVNDTCGLHIHVDTSDFNGNDKAKLLRFGSGIELLMFSLVDSTRYYGRGNGRGENEYCVKLHKDWRKIYRRSYINQNIHANEYSDLSDFIMNVRQERRNNGNGDRIWNGRYQWLNAQVDGIPTVEFRIFSATEDYAQAQRFGMLAYHIVETVKNSTVEQIKFIIKSIYQSLTVEEMLTKFFDSIGLDSNFRPSILNDGVTSYLDQKYCERNRQQQHALSEINEAV